MYRYIHVSQIISSPDNVDNIELALKAVTQTLSGLQDFLIVFSNKYFAYIVGLIFLDDS